MRLINEKIHGIIDYASALALMIAPFLLGLPESHPAAAWLSVAAGAGLLVYSALTSYSLGLQRVIPFNVHLGIDLLAGVSFVAAPFALGFAGTARLYYLVMGTAVVFVVLLTSPRAEGTPARAVLER